MPRGTLTKNKGAITPLWIIAAFVTFTETVLGYALTKVAGGVQISLTAFVIVFAVCVAGAFFTILWNRPYVFYAPSEYGNVDPQKFIHAMKGVVPQRVIEGVEHIKSNPESEIAKFELVDNLVDRTPEQHLIAMNLNNSKVSLVRHMREIYTTGNKDDWMSRGGFSGEDLWSSFKGTGFLELNDEGPSITLTTPGKRFVAWLEKSGKKADFYDSPLGRWGEALIPPNGPIFAAAPPAIRPTDLPNAHESPNG